MTNKTIYPFLDQCRGIAILWVMLHHLQLFFSYNDFLHAIYYAFLKIGINLKAVINFLGFPFQYISNIGYLGVDMFFVISGFLITGLLLEGLDGKLDLKRFYIRRFFKIVPQYYLIVIVGFITFILFEHPMSEAYPNINSHGPIAYLSYFIFLQNYTLLLPNLGHTWSLAVEEHFYLIYPLFFLMCCRIGKTPFQRRSLLLLVCILIMLCGQLIRMNFYHFIEGQRLDVFFRTNTTYLMSHFRMDALMFGCFLRLLEPYYVGRSQGLKILGLLCAVVGTYIYFGFYTTQIDWLKGQWYAFSFAYLAPGLLIFALYQWVPQGIKMFGFLSWIGRNSYGIYLWHYILISLCSLMVSSISIIPAVLLYIFASIGFGVWSTQTIEKWGLNQRAKLAP